ncbi:MAG: LacI family DNA-binding transcriptional regulator [Chloroflexota bacterium]
MATITDVALLAGVSEGTVSNVFGGRVGVREATRTRVLAAARQLDYQPNGPARALRTGHSRTIGFCVSHANHPMTGAVMHGASRRAHAAGYTVQVGVIESDAGLERAHLDGMFQQRVAAVLTYAANDNPEPYLTLQRSRVPVVFVQSRPAGVVADLVMPDHRGGVLAATRHLLRAGRRRVAFLITGELARAGSVARLAGYAEAHREANLSPDRRLVRARLVSGDEAYAAMAELLAMAPDAVLCGGSLLTLGALNHLRDRGIAVPDSVAVVGIGDRTWLRQMRLPLPVVAIDGEALGAAAVEAVLQRLEPGADLPAAREILVPTEFIAGGLAPVGALAFGGVLGGDGRQGEG